MKKNLNLTIREPNLQDEEQYLNAMQHSKIFHADWVNPPSNSEEFKQYLIRYKQANQKCYLILDDKNLLLGVFHLNEIVMGVFKNAFLGFYAVAEHAGKGYMSQGLQRVLDIAFNELNLHRVEASIQPDNVRSINFIKKNNFRYEGYSPRYLYLNHKWRGHEHWVMTREEFMIDKPQAKSEDTIKLEKYDPIWIADAKDEIKQICEKLPASMIIDIQHVGSTAIPNLSAKPIIDIQIIVTSLEIAKLIAVPQLQRLEYEFWEQNPDKNRLFFAKGMPPFGNKRTHHVHIVEQSNSQALDKIIFRDYLTAHPDIAKQYENLKIMLASKYETDREKYTDEKKTFINDVLSLAK